VIIGGNSTCKTTLLRAIAIGLCPEAHAAALLSELPASFIGPSADEASIVISIRSSYDSSEETTIVTTIRPGSHKTPNASSQKMLSRHRRFSEDIVKREPQPEDSKEPFPEQLLFVCGYGAGRTLDATESYTRYRTVDSVYTLFRYDQTLQNPELILLRLERNYRRIYKATLDKIREILSLDRRHKFRLDEAGITISGPRFGSDIPLEAVADGYRTAFSWLCDLVGWAMLAGRIDKTKGDIEGIVLVDELEQHLHPTLQASLIPFIKRIFPNLQLIATTHSPLVALGIDSESLVVLKRSRGYVHAERHVPDFSGYSAEDMLTDPEIFDTQAYSPETNRKLKRYHALIGIPKSRRTVKQRRELRALISDLQEEQILSMPDDALVKELKKMRKKYNL
jgi:predicted ATP-binding protein involved in virulence